MAHATIREDETDGTQYRMGGIRVSSTSIHWYPKPGVATRVLVVDDDRKTVDLLRMYLERDGYEVSAACDGHQAIQAAEQHRPDLIVLDLMLPRVDGLDACQAIRARQPVPIVMLTARSTEEDKLAGLDLGADDYRQDEPRTAGVEA